MTKRAGASVLNFGSNVVKPVFTNSVEHALEHATLYAPCFFFPVHLSWKRKKRIALIMSLRFARGRGWTGVRKNVLMGRWDMVSATEGRNDTSGVSKEPCYRCA